MKKNLFFLMLVGAMSSCGNAPQNSENNDMYAFDSTAVTISDEVAGVETRSVPFEAINGKWMIKSAKSEAVAEGDTSAYIIINVAEKTINATAGCNSIFGAINRNGRTDNSLAFENMGATRMMCQDKDAIERALIDALNNTRSFTLSNGELSFCNENNEVVLKAAK